MIYRNDNIKETNDKIIGTIKDLLEYFRYELASQCMTGDKEKENFIDNAKSIIDLIENLHENIDNNIYTENTLVAIMEHPMGGFIIREDID